MRIVRTGARDRLPRPQKALLLGRHRRALAPRGAIRMIRSIRPIRLKLLFLMRDHPRIGMFSRDEVTTPRKMRRAT